MKGYRRESLIRFTRISTKKVQTEGGPDIRSTLVLGINFYVMTEESRTVLQILLIPEFLYNLT